MAATTTTIDGQKALQWVQAVTELKGETDTILKQASNALSEIKTTSDGDIAQTFARLGEETISAFNKLVVSIADCVRALADAVDKFAELENAVTEGIKGALKTFLGISI